MDDSCVVRLSYTTKYIQDDQDNTNQVVPAIASKVLIKDNEGAITELVAYTPGVYDTKTLKGKVGNNYKTCGNIENTINPL